MRAGYWPIVAILGLLFSAGARMHAAPTPEVQQTLAPTGKLRVGLISGVPVMVMQDPASGEMKGVAFDLGQELARRMGVPFEPVLYPSIRILLDSGKSGDWDAAFIALSPARAKEWDFTAPHLEIELGYLVPSGSTVSTSTEVDRHGIRVGVAEGGLADRLLTPAIKVAKLIRVPTTPDGLEMLKAGRADVFAANKPSLFDMSDQLPGSRVLDGRFAAERVALAIPKGRDAGLAYARKFIEDAKAEGLVKSAIERAGLRGAVVAPFK